MTTILHISDNLAVHPEHFYRKQTEEGKIIKQDKQQKSIIKKWEEAKHYDMMTKFQAGFEIRHKRKWVQALHGICETRVRRVFFFMIFLSDWNNLADSVMSANSAVSFKNQRLTLQIWRNCVWLKLLPLWQIQSCLQTAPILQKSARLILKLWPEPLPWSLWTLRLSLWAMSRTCDLHLSQRCK